MRRWEGGRGEEENMRRWEGEKVVSLSDQSQWSVSVISLGW